MRAERLALSTAALAATLALSSAASAFCRTTTCDPRDGTECHTDANGCVTDGIPLVWPGACVGFDLQQDALPGKITLQQATNVAHLAFLTWQNTVCPAPTTGHPSIRFADLGPVACDKHEYNQNQGNANIILFRSGSWPYANSANTLALTTVTYNIDTGAIYDADMEINGTVPLTVGTPVQYDLQSIMTHEAGHFIGFAHSSDPDATMYAKYATGSTSLRTLHTDDVNAVCSVYAPNRQTPACDPTPRHGFAGDCALDGTGGSGCCTTAPGRTRAGGAAAVAVLGLGLALYGARRRRR